MQRCGCDLPNNVLCSEANCLRIRMVELSCKGYSHDSPEYQQALENYRKHFRAWGQRQDWQRY